MGRLGMPGLTIVVVVTDVGSSPNKSKPVVFVTSSVVGFREPTTEHEGGTRGAMHFQVDLRSIGRHVSDVTKFVVAWLLLGAQEVGFRGSPL